jgi:RNA polymerase sigma-70 factor (ECF subfamily)
MTTSSIRNPDEPRERTDVEQYRPRLFGIAYRMLGDSHEAEDLVQETMFRWHQANRDDVREPEGWLVTVVTRLAIDRARAAARERERYPGPWLPEPLALERMEADYRAELTSDLSMAFLVLVEQLAPEERAAFLLREVFGTDYDEIGSILDRSAVAVRQMVHRARKRVRDGSPRRVATAETRERLFGRFVAALEAGDKDALLAVLAEDTSWVSDGGGKARTSRRVVRGAERIARLVLGLNQKFRPSIRRRFARLNGELALLQYRDDRLHAVIFLDVDGDRITSIYGVVNPDKLHHVE